MAKKKNPLARFMRLVWWGLGAAAVAKELQSPPGERQWHGHVAGVVPYDFRPPTPERIRNSLWRPDDDQIFTDTAFGIGWGVNVGRLAKLARRA